MLLAHGSPAGAWWGTNQSTRYYPDPDSWPAVGAALDRIGVPHPGDFTDQVVFRCCANCIGTPVAHSALARPMASLIAW